MAEEQQPEAAEAPKSGSLMKFILPAIIVVVAIIGAMLLFQLFVKPRLASSGNGSEEAAPPPSIPLEGVTVDFEEFTTNAKLDPDEEGAAALFIYHVALECSNQDVADLIGARKPRFRDIIGRVHEFRTRDELNDPLLKKSIKKQVLQEVNQALTELLGEDAGPENRVTAVFYDKWFIYDRI
jgi:flagellar basal body-associated protein FliL